MDSVAAVVGSRVASFELGILCQIFGLDRSDDGLPTYDFAVCGPRPGLVPTTSGFSIEVTHGLDRTAEADLVAVPAWPDLDAPLDVGVATALREASERCAALLAICTGAFALAGAGLLDGRRATTHWQFTERLARQFPRVQIERDVLYVSDGPILTSAGAAAGIDACLHMLRSVHDRECTRPPDGRPRPPRWRSGAVRGAATAAGSGGRSQSGCRAGLGNLPPGPSAHDVGARRAGPDVTAQLRPTLPRRHGYDTAPLAARAAPSAGGASTRDDQPDSGRCGAAVRFR